MSQDLEDTGRRGVTLARVAGAEQGRGYTTIVFTHDDDDRGAHMRQHIKRRRVRRVP